MCVNVSTILIYYFDFLMISNASSKKNKENKLIFLNVSGSLKEKIFQPSKVLLKLHKTLKDEMSSHFKVIDSHTKQTTVEISTQLVFWIYSPKQKA